MSKTRKWKVRFQEVGNKKIGETTHSGSLDEKGVIEFFGLNGPDIVWYEVKEMDEL
jgi:hypothetical protein